MDRRRHPLVLGRTVSLAPGKVAEPTSAMPVIKGLIRARITSNRRHGTNDALMAATVGWAATLSGRGRTHLDENGRVGPTGSIWLTRDKQLALMKIRAMGYKDASSARGS